MVRCMTEYRDAGSTQALGIARTLVRWYRNQGGLRVSLSAGMYER
jgi:hypothetical protein